MRKPNHLARPPAINKGPAREKRARTLKGREAVAEERFRELVAWYTLQGVDEATARVWTGDNGRPESRGADALRDNTHTTSAPSRW